VRRARGASIKTYACSRRHILAKGQALTSLRDIFHFSSLSYYKYDSESCSFLGFFHLLYYYQ